MELLLSCSAARAISDDDPDVVFAITDAKRDDDGGTELTNIACNTSSAALRTSMDEFG